MESDGWIVMVSLCKFRAFLRLAKLAQASRKEEREHDSFFYPSIQNTLPERMLLVLGVQ